MCEVVERDGAIASTAIIVRSMWALSGGRPGEEDVILLFDTERIAHWNRSGVDVSGDAIGTPCAPL